jgi:hypothetical protein
MVHWFSVSFHYAFVDSGTCLSETSREKTVPGLKAYRQFFLTLIQKGKQYVNNTV